MQTQPRFLRVLGRPTQLLRPWPLARALADALGELARLPYAVSPLDSAWADLGLVLRRAALELSAHARGVRPSSVASGSSDT